MIWLLRIFSNNNLLLDEADCEMKNYADQGGSGFERIIKQ